MSEAIFPSSINVSINDAISAFVEDVEVKEEKISNVPVEERIKLDNDTIFRFSCSVEDENLKLKLSEIGSFAPYIYEKLISLDEMKQQYKMFRSCENLKEVKRHIDNLFRDKKIELTKDKEDTITFNLTVYSISEVKKIQIEANRIMTTKKDDALIRLYHIEKDQIKLLKEIDKYCKNLGPNGNNIVEKINAIRKKYE